ncbi:lethal(2)essential for life-like 2, partial [Homarus americanus]
FYEAKRCAVREDILHFLKVSTETRGEAQTQSSVTQSSQMSTHKTVSITKKGQFFSDSCFEDTRQDFQDAIKDVLTKCGDKTTKGDELTTYRTLRTRELKDETQAIKSSDDELYHKIVVDVNDFINGGEVNVRTVEEREVVVEGRVERQVGNTRSSKSFKRSFTLPDNIQVEALTAVVSSDGVLIIRAPKKPSAATPSEVSITKTQVKKQVQSSVTTETDGQAVDKTVSAQTQNVSQATKQAQKSVVSQQVTQQTKTASDTTATEPGCRALPITKKGSFFDDSFFEDSRQNFQQAIKQVLEKFNETSTQTDDITTYRNLRQRNLKEENQAVTVKEDQHTHKIIVDVQDFVNGGEVTVKTVDNREVVIEGHIEKQEGNTRSSKRFCKRFVLPEDIDVETVTSVVSTDGVLTIIAPRKPSAKPVMDVSVQKTETKKQVQTSTVTTTEGQDVKEAQVTTQEVAKDAQDVTSQQQTVQQKTVSTVTQQEEAPVTIQKITKVMKTVTTTESEEDSEPTPVQTPEVKETDETVVRQQVVTQQTKTVSDTTATEPGSRALPITKKGGFFDDSFFEDSRQNFQQAIKQVLEKFNETSTQTDDITTYRNLRQRNLKEENQAVTVKEDQQTHKIIVDVQDFVNGGKVTVKTVDNREVVIEGHIEKQEGNTRSSKRFCKRFVLPEDIDVETVTSVVSTDGVLTIIAPRKPSAKPVMDVSVQKTETKKQVQTSTVTTTEGQDVKEAQVTTQEVAKDAQDVTSQQQTVQQKTVSTVTEQEEAPVTIQKITKVMKTVTTTESEEDSEPTPVQTPEVKETDETVVRQQVVTQQTKTVSDTTATEPGSRALPITKKGGFFDDSFFEDSRQNFQQAIKQVLEKFNETSTQTDDITTYRNLRQRNLKEENQAVTVKEDQQTHKIIVDVQDFVNGGKVTVKTVDNREVVIEGHIEKQEGNTRSSKRFCKRFVLPEDIDVETVTSVVSTDGVLTIIAPRKIIVDVQDFVNGGEVTVKTVDNREVVIEGHIEKQEGNTRSSKRFCKRFVLPEDIDVETVTSVVSTDGVLTIIAPRKPSAKPVMDVSVQKTETKKQVQTSTVTTTEGQDVKEAQVTTQEVAKDAQDVTSQQQTVQQKTVSTVTQQEEAPVTIQKITKVMKTVTTTESEEDSEPTPVQTPEVKETDETVVRQQVVTQQTKTVSDTTATEPGSRALPITKKGGFFDDSFFEDSRQNFQQAIKQVLEKFNETSTQTDDITTYRNLRQRNLKEENQAVTVKEDQQTQKMIVDVQDFINGGEVTVRIVNKREVVIEGRIEKQEGNTRSSKRFCKRFVLAEDIDEETVTSVVSADGVLTVIAPKKPTRKQVEAPVSTEKITKVVKTITTTEGQDVSEPTPAKTTQVVKGTDEKTVSTVSQQKTVSDTTTTTTDVVRRIITIIKKGFFFEDSFFEDSRQLFQSAVRKVLEKFNETSSKTDDITTYRNLRQRNLKEENQAVTVNEGQQVHKIIVDVKDFITDGKVTVKTVNEREVVIEGQVEKQEGNTKSTKRFCKRFVLPEDIDVESVSSVVSADGVLTIITQKKVTKTTVVTKQDATVAKTDTSKKEVSSDTSQTSKTVTTSKKTVDRSTITRTITVVTKGAFSTDSAFANIRQEFQSSIKTVIEKFKLKSSGSDDFTTYRNFRKSNPKNENQAVSMKDTDEAMTMVLDVCDFIGGLKVQLIEGKEIKVEGKGNRQQGSSVVSFSFMRGFQLYDNTDLDAITAVMSSEGILTIIAPKMK